MNKGILVLDKIPVTCGECLCSEAYIDDEGRASLRCKSAKKTVPDSILVSGFAEGFCPIKPLPKKKSTGLKDYEEEMINIGFNQCISELEGKK